MDDAHFISYRVSQYFVIELELKIHTLHGNVIIWSNAMYVCDGNEFYNMFFTEKFPYIYYCCLAHKYD